MKTPDEIEKSNRYQSYLKGWRDGAKGVSKDPKFAQHATLGAVYAEGYEAGRVAWGEACMAATERFGYEPSPLRTTPPPEAGR